MTQASLVMFAVFVGIALVITYWAAGRSTSRRGFYAADREISGAQNGWAIAGDYMSASSFLGITGLIAFYGFDGFLYAIGLLVAYLTVLFLLAEPLRHVGRYTVAGVIAFRLRGRGVRAIAAMTTLIITLFYMVAQMVGAGALINLLIQRIDGTYATLAVGVLILVYVLYGGMLATTWVQIIKAVLLLGASIVLSVLVLAHYHFSLAAFLNAASAAGAGGGITHNLLQPGLLFSGPYGPVDSLSLGLALVLGTAGLPHVLMRFFTVPTARSARASVGWAMGLIGIFFLLTTIMGLGAGTIVGLTHVGKHLRDTEAIRYIAHHPQTAAHMNAELARYHYIVPQLNDNLAAPILANETGGPLLTAFVAAVAFAAILAVVAGLTIAAASAFANDIWYRLVRNRKSSEHEHLIVARATAIAVSIAAIALSVSLRTANVAYLVGLAFAVAASANAPTLLLSLAWRRFSRAGAICGMLVGLVSSLALIAIGPEAMGTHALFPLTNPGIVSIPLGFLAAVAGTLLARDRESEAMFNELRVRANTGIGAEV